MNNAATPTAAAPAAANKAHTSPGRRQARFLAQSALLEEGGSSALIRLAMMTLGGVFIAFVVWASVSRVEEVATTTGEVVPTGQVQKIQHLGGGIISQILVKDNDIVDAGTVLLRLNPVAANSELMQLVARNASLEARAERLRAFLSKRKADFSRISSRFAELVTDQRSFLNMQRLSRKSRQSVVHDQIAQKKIDVSLLDGQKETLVKNIAILEEKMRMQKQLYKDGLTSKIKYLDVKRDINKAHGDLMQVKGERRRAKRALGEIKNQLLELNASIEKDAMLELDSTTSELMQVREAVRKMKDNERRMEIKAPVRGIVKGLTAHTVDGVVIPGEVIMEIVPLDTKLMLEVRITSRDVGHVKVGQSVTVKITTYDFSRYGSISGTLKAVSATTFLDEKQNPYYMGIISLDKNYVGGNPDKNKVFPGMTVQADIKTGDKTIMQYLLKPIYASVNQAFRER